MSGMLAHPPEVSEPPPLGWSSGNRRIVVAVDAARPCDRLLAVAVAAAIEHDALLTVITTTPSEVALTWCGWGCALAIDRSEFRREAVIAAEERLAAAYELISPSVLATTRIVPNCGRRRALLREARTGRHSVAVLDRPRRGWLRGLAARWERRRLLRCGIAVVVAGPAIPTRA